MQQGERYGRLTAIRFVRMNKWRSQEWLFKCDCGKEKIIKISSVKNGSTRSCDCLRIESVVKAITKHNMSGTKIYHCWVHMIQRCKNINNEAYKNYGGRGISVCDSWLSFENFYSDMGDMPADKSLDRIDNNGNYELSNCRWATKIEQCNNVRSNKFIEFNGISKTISQWSRETGIHKATLNKRIFFYNWDLERAFFLKPSLKNPRLRYARKL